MFQERNLISISSTTLFAPDEDSNNDPETGNNRMREKASQKPDPIKGETSDGLVSSSPSDDPFSPSNLARMKLDQDFAAMAAVKPIITSVAVRKPSKHEFVRVRPGADWRFQTGCFVDKVTREVYLVTRELWPAMPGDVTQTALMLAMSRNSPVPFLWPLVLPSSDGQPNRWHESGIEAARLAESQWLRSVADMAAGCYVPFMAAAKLPDPEWPSDLTMNDYLRLAFQSRMISNLSHPCLKRLRGEI